MMMSKFVDNENKDKEKEKWQQFELKWLFFLSFLPSNKEKKGNACDRGFTCKHSRAADDNNNISKGKQK